MANIHQYLKYREPIIERIPRDDYEQTFAECELQYKINPNGTFFNYVRRNLRKLAADLGLIKKSICLEDLYSVTESEANTNGQLFQAIEDFYLEQDHTGKETAQRFGFEYNSRTRKILHNLFPKQAGHGGARKNAGKKKQNDK